MVGEWENSCDIPENVKTNVKKIFTKVDLHMIHFPFAKSRYYHATQNYPKLVTALVIKACIEANK